MRAADEGRAVTVRVDVLGPLRLIVDGDAVDVRGPKRRAVLALLAVAEGRAVTVDYLLDALLWPAELPDSARATLHSHVSRLRGHLGSAATRLETLDSGYRLVLGNGELDAARARSLLEQGRQNAQRDPSGVCMLLREARALWRGPVLADLAEVAPLVRSAVAYEQLYREVTDLLMACAIDAGELDGVVRLATEALAADPLREPAVLLLMRALAVTGQAPQALRTAREYRRQLAEETGLELAADAEGRRYCLTSLAVAYLSRGAFADVVRHSLAAAAVATRPTQNLGVAALAATYAGDLHLARELNERTAGVAASPTMRAFGEYVAGEIDSAAGRRDRAEEHYARAIELARSSGATFVIGVATVGQLTLRADAGRVHDALRGYRDVIDYWAQAGNWTHQWVTLRNLAQLLRQVARQAIERNLAGA